MTPLASRLSAAIRTAPDPDAAARECLEIVADEIARLEKLVYVPGLWRCAKCDFRLVQANLNMPSGTVTARDQPGDKCPNCDGPLWRVTEREAGNDMVDRCEASEAALRRAKAMLADAGIEWGQE